MSSKVQEEILKQFFERLEGCAEISDEIRAKLREVLHSDTKFEAADLMAIFSRSEENKIP